MITKIPVPYIVRATSKDHGVDVIVLPGTQKAPEYWDHNRFTLALHQDGSHCDNYCGCMADEKEGHHMAKVQLNDDSRLIADLRTRLCGEGMERRALESSVRQLSSELYPLARELPWLRWSAATGWGLALALAVLLVWAVIA